MTKTRKALLNLVAGLALASLAPSALVAEDVANQELKPKNIAYLEKSASSGNDFSRIAYLYKLRADKLDEKVAKHERLEKRFAAAPASLLAKRGSSWNTPVRQRKLAETARRQALEAREMAARYLGKADEASTEVD